MPTPKITRWLRFSLRTLLLAMAALCIWMGLKVHAAYRQREAVRAILNAGGTVRYDYETMARRSLEFNEAILTGTYRYLPPPGPAWLRQLIGGEYFQDVVEVSLAESAIRESDYVHLGKLLGNLPALHTLHLHVRIVPNDGGTPRRIRDADLQGFGRLNTLRVLTLGGDINGSSLASLVNPTRIKRLELVGAPIDDAGMSQIGKLTGLEDLWLRSTPISDASLGHLQQLSHLEHLDIAATKITDAGLLKLKPLTNLRGVYLKGAPVTEAGIRELHKSIPNARFMNPPYTYVFDP